MYLHLFDDKREVASKTPEASPQPPEAPPETPVEMPGVNLEPVEPEVEPSLVDLGWDRIRAHVWPAKFESLYPHQVEAVTDILRAFQHDRVVFLDAPVGSGKTIIAEAVRIALGGRSLYVCSGRELQHQLADDFPYLPVLMGRANYPTLDHPTQFPAISAADCDKQNDHCSLCFDVHGCAYEMAKADVLQSGVGVLNSTYFLTEANFVGRMSNQDFVIMDEGDTLEDVILGFVEMNISRARLRTLEMWEPKKGVHKATLDNWLGEVRVAINRRLAVLGDGEDDGEGGNRNAEDKQKSKERLGLNSLRWKINLVRGDLDNWIREYDRGGFVMKPIRVDKIGERFLWRHSKRWLVMSGTIIGAESMAKSLGVSLMPAQIPAAQTGHSTSANGQ